jgi:hypothetical protein
MAVYPLGKAQGGFGRLPFHPDIFRVWVILLFFISD